MIKHKSREYRVESIIRDLDKDPSRAGKLYLNFPNQRAFCWAREPQSLLIHTILQGEIVPEIWITRDGAGEIRPKTVIDGKQRCTTIYQFYNNVFRLSKNTPPVKIEVPIENDNGELTYEIREIEIAGKKYKDLDERLRFNFLDYDLLMREIIDASETEINNIMFKLNNGKPLNTTQKAITRLNLTLAAELEKISKNDFFEERISYTTAQIKASEGMKCALNTLVLYTGKDFNKINSAQDMTKIAIQFNDEWSQLDIDQVNQMFLMLNNLLPVENERIEKFLTTNNIPILIMNIDKYCQMVEDGEITEEQYKAFLEYWFENGIKNPLYTQYEDKSISQKSHIEGRIDVMELALLLFLQGKTLEDSEEYEEYITNLETNEMSKASVVENNSATTEVTEMEIVDSVDSDEVNVIEETVVQPDRKDETPGEEMENNHIEEFFDCFDDEDTGRQLLENNNAFVKAG